VEIEGTGAVRVPGLARERRIVDDDELAWGGGRVGGEVHGAPWSPVQADLEGSGEKRRMWLRVSSVAGSKSCQRLGGKVTMVDARTDKKWLLAVRMERSALLARWFWVERTGTWWGV
jgi:hypothetical protein